MTTNNLKKNVLIIGGSGFIGKNLIDKYIEQGYYVLNYDKVPYETYTQNSIENFNASSEAQDFEKIFSSYEIDHIVYLINTVHPSYKMDMEIEKKIEENSVLKKKYDYYHEKLDFETNKKATNKRISLKEFVPIKFLKRVYHFLVKNKVFIYFLKVLNNFKAFRYLKYKLNEKIHFIPHQVIHSYSGVETSIDFIKIETNIIHGIDNILQLPSIIKINGWFLVPSRNITEFEKFICVIDSSGEVKKVFSTTVLEREDINRYFSDEFDYSSSGFITIIDKEKIQEKDFSIGLLLIDKVTKETYFKTTETKISI